MSRRNLFIGIPNDKLKECYDSYVRVSCKRENEQELFSDLVTEYNSFIVLTTGIYSPLFFLYILFIHYLFSNMLSPVISAGCSIPNISNRVGAKSANLPDLIFKLSSFDTSINGTGFVVCAVCGSPVL